MVDRYLLATIALSVTVVALVLSNNFYQGILVTNVAQNATDIISNETVNQTDFLVEYQAFMIRQLDAQADHTDRELVNINGNLSILIQLLNNSSR